MDEATAETERKTRSGRKISSTSAAAGTKRKRESSSNPIPPKKKMSSTDSIAAQLDSLKAFFSDKMEENRKKISDDKLPFQ